jgi:hypothetical protein
VWLKKEISEKLKDLCPNKGTRFHGAFVVAVAAYDGDGNDDDDDDNAAVLS